MTLTDSCMTTKNGSSDLVEGLDGRSVELRVDYGPAAE